MTKLLNIIPDTVKLPLLRFYLIPKRTKIAFTYFRQPIYEIGRWIFKSKEVANFTFDLTAQNRLYLAHFISIITNETPERIMDYFSELESNKNLSDQIISKVRVSNYRYMADDQVKWGRRLGWYAFVRVLKPKIVVETGVDKGLGASAITAALLKNNEEGHKGIYYGTDIDPSAGYLLGEPYAKFGQILYGDSVKSLKKISKKIDLFINDSDHSSGYERKEYFAIKDKLSKKAVVLGDNSHVTNELAKFAGETGRNFLFFKEIPKNHWYPGCGIGVAFIK